MGNREHQESAMTRRSPNLACSAGERQTWLFLPSFELHSAAHTFAPLIPLRLSDNAFSTSDRSSFPINHTDSNLAKWL